MIGIVLTYNEENILANCINGLKLLCNEILVIDSFSTDRTVEIANSLGCSVYQNKFEGYASQRNFALSKINSNAKWIAMIDADEIITENLAHEIKLKMKNTISAIYVKRAEYFLGKRLYFAAGYGQYFPRFFVRESVAITREINERYEIKGKTIKLNNRLNHYSFNKGISHWIHKHNRYSDMEAALIESTNNSTNTLRHRIKSRLYKSNFKIPILSIYYLFRFPFLDGKAGIYFITLKMFYEFLISAKYYERKTL